MAVMRAKCRTCPFAHDGAKDVRAHVEARSLVGINQTCHEADDAFLCRGARDFQLQIFHALGFLSEPTDAAWDERKREVLGRER